MEESLLGEGESHVQRLTRSKSPARTKRPVDPEDNSDEEKRFPGLDWEEPVPEIVIDPMEVLDGFASDPGSRTKLSRRNKVARLPRLDAGRTRRRKRGMRPAELGGDEVLAPREERVRRVSGVCFASKLDLQRALEAFAKVKVNTTILNQEVIHVKLMNSSERSDIFVFTNFGCVVFWNMSESQELKVIAGLKEECAADVLPETDSDDFNYVYATDSSVGFQIVKDFLILAPFQTDRKDTMVKLSFSYALATSLKLGVFEVQVDNVIEGFESIPQELATEGKVVSLTKHQVSCKIGEIFIYKASLNLMYDILDKPEFFWDYPDLEAIYNISRRNVEIDQRVEVLNKRMEVLSELLSILQEEKSEQHSTKLEWIVIWLIIFEVVIGVLDILVALREPRK